MAVSNRVVATKTTKVIGSKMVNSSTKQTNWDVNRYFLFFIAVSTLTIKYVLFLSKIIALFKTKEARVSIFSDGE